MKSYSIIILLQFILGFVCNVETLKAQKYNLAKTYIQNCIPTSNDLVEASNTFTFEDGVELTINASYQKGKFISHNLVEKKNGVETKKRMGEKQGNLSLGNLKVENPYQWFFTGDKKYILVVKREENAYNKLIVLLYRLQEEKIDIQVEPVTEK